MHRELHKEQLIEEEQVNTVSTEPLNRLKGERKPLFNNRGQGIWQAVAVLLLLILIVGCLYWARPILIPTAVAILLSFILSPVVGILQRRGLSRTVAAVTVVTISTVTMAVLSALLITQLVQLADDLPRYKDGVAKKIAALRENGRSGTFTHVKEFLDTVQTAATRPLSTAEANEVSAAPVRIVEPNPTLASLSDMSSLPPIAEPLSAAGLIFILVIYLLIYREDVRSRALCLAGTHRITLLTKALDDAGKRLSKFLLAQFILNAAFGVIVTIALAIFGVPYAILWGLSAGLLRYVPFIGPWLAAGMPLLLSLLIFDDWTRPLGILCLFLACELITNLVVEPWIYGQSIGASQQALILAMAFWTWLWGPIGLMLAAPLTVCVVVLGKHIPDLRFFDILLGDEPVLSVDVRFYQRLLARDKEEATEIANQEAVKCDRVELCDALLLPTLNHARRDWESGSLGALDYDFIQQTLVEIVEEEDMLAEPTTLEITRSYEPRLRVFACPARDDGDAIVIELLKQLVDTKKFELHQLGRSRLVGEILDAVERDHPEILLITSLPPGGLNHVRNLSKRLKARFPKIKLLVARCGDTRDLESQREFLTEAGIDFTASSLAETLKELAVMSQFLRPDERSTELTDQEERTDRLEAAAS